MIFAFSATAIRVIWLVIEYPYVRRFRVSPARDWDRHSAKVWDVANVIEPVELILGSMGIGRIQTAAEFIAPLGLILLVFGIVIRWWAIWTLGKFFTSTVLIKDDHQLVRTGLYRYLRHPLYRCAIGPSWVRALVL